MSSAEPPVKRKKEETIQDKDIMDTGSKDKLNQVPEEKRSVSPDMFSDNSPPVDLDISAAGSSNAQDVEHNSSLGSLVDSPDVLSDFSATLDLLENSLYIEAENPVKEEQEKEEQEKNANSVESCPWKGVSLEELRGKSLFPQMPPIRLSKSHTVLCQVTSNTSKTPLPPQSEAWDADHVRMPFSSQNLYPVTVGSGKTNLRSRWEMVKDALSKSITSSMQFETAIMSYNSKYSRQWNFSGLHLFFSEVLEPVEVKCFFNKLLPNIIQLALQLPILVNHPIPLLRQHQNHSISLSQLQIASLLANALLCTFPRRNTSKRDSEYAFFPDINFNRLYAFQRNKSSSRACEKLKCIFHYFRRVCNSAPEGVVTFSRQYIPPNNLPQWSKSIRTFNKLHVSSVGTIEDEGYGMLQMDFANKRIGGGVLGWGCVQEEIRFVICPELIISRLFTESLDVTEAVLISGCERFSDYTGYADNFEWDGDHQDKTPRDSSGRLICSIVAIDAIPLRFPSIQFLPENMRRELNKAYVGFYNSDIPSEQLAPVATGNWGCGAYRGNSRLKALLQMMAAAEAGRSLAYFTFGEKDLCDDLFNMHTFLKEHEVTVGQLWNIVSLYYDQCYHDGKWTMELYTFVEEMIDPSKSSDEKRFFPPKEGKNKGAKTKVKQAEKPSGKSSITNFISKCVSKSPNKYKDKNKEVLNIDKKKASPLKDDAQKISRNDLSNLSKSEASDASSKTQKTCIKELAGGSVKEEPLLPSNKDLASDYSVDNKTGATAIKHDSKAGSSNHKESLLDSLELYDNVSSATPKRKISDYFSAINVPK